MTKSPRTRPGSKAPTVSPRPRRRTKAPAVVAEDTSSDDERNSKHFRRFPDEVTAYLRQWMLDHIDHPYPSREEKKSLAKETNLSHGQLQQWFTNQRKRHWKPVRNGKKPARPFEETVAAKIEDTQPKKVVKPTKRPTAVKRTGLEAFPSSSSSAGVADAEIFSPKRKRVTMALAGEDAFEALAARTHDHFVEARNRDLALQGAWRHNEKTSASPGTPPAPVPYFRDTVDKTFSRHHAQGHGQDAHGSRFAPPPMSVAMFPRRRPAPIRTASMAGGMPNGSQGLAITPSTSMNGFVNFGDRRMYAAEALNLNAKAAQARHWAFNAAAPHLRVKDSRLGAKPLMEQTLSGFVSPGHAHIDEFASSDSSSSDGGMEAARNDAYFGRGHDQMRGRSRPQSPAPTLPQGNAFWSFDGPDGGDACFDHVAQSYVMPDHAVVLDDDQDEFQLEDVVGILEMFDEHC